jgi:hypothetical protein
MTENIATREQPRGESLSSASTDHAPVSPVSRDPAHIMQVGMGFCGSKTLLSAVELGLFT